MDALCTYRGERDWVYDGRSFPSASAAAQAAAKDLGMRSKPGKRGGSPVNGLVFWGLKSRKDRDRERWAERRGYV